MRMFDTSGRPIVWIVWSVGIGVAIIAIVSIAIAAENATATDKDSYKAGWETGASWARNTLIVAGAVGIPDAEIIGTCPGLARYAENAQMYYHASGNMAGAKIRHADFIAGCVAGARRIVGR
ncbi:hypothetical protein [Mycolicibacter minnesotensis]|uniref:hypothetical protein n=1 Tax=Mycolicibacter minnesotensis TaxID=1118379 RepID=UPI00105580BB|nr:hypothetical protein [Mycolicibacter minnesotensis]BBY32426.1 hypothetical protein MMIN_04870 [Mycolicibacter minnesotensis]